MGGGHHKLGPAEVARKALIVLMFVGGTILLHRLAVPDGELDPRGLLALGLIVLAAYTIGELAEVVRVPHITGYLLAGLALGPSAAHVVHDLLPDVHLPPPLDHGVLSENVIGQLGLIDALALALIALTAGGELKLGALRAGARQIGAVLVGQVVLVCGIVTATVYGVVRLMPQALPSLAALGDDALLPLAAVVAAISVSTSPAATVALVNGMGARGPVATTTLTTVVLKELVTVLLFAVATTLAVGALGVIGAPTLGQSLGRVAVSMALGVALGGGIHLYLRYIGAELLLFLVSMVYTATFVVQGLEGQPALTFLVAGVLVGNWSDRGEMLIAEVERLSLPVYVVFFTLAGAKLHLNELMTMLVPALALAGARGLGLFGGVRIGATISGAPAEVRRVAWMGFVSQAGLAIVLSSQVLGTFREGGIGTTLFSLLLGAVAINEMVGPVMLQQALISSGEVRGSAAQREVEVPDGETWADPEDAWAAPPPAGWSELDDTLDRFAADVRSIVTEGVAGPLEELRRERMTWLRTLRRELVRLTRRALARTGGGPELASALRADVGELGLRWRDLVPELAAADTPGWSPLALVEAVDRHLVALPEGLPAPVPGQVTEPRDEGRLRRLRRALLRLRERWWPVQREVPLRTLARYNLSGTVPLRLEPLAAHLVGVDLRLAHTTAELFGKVAAGFEAAARAAEAGEPTPAVVARLGQLQREVEQRFQLAFEALARAIPEGEAHAAVAFGGGLRRFREDVAVVGTLDLPHRARRFGRVFRERNRGLALLTAGLSEGRAFARTGYHRLALELEVGALAARARDTVRIEGTGLVGRVRAHALRPSEGVVQAVAGWLERAKGALATDVPAAALAGTLRREAEPLLKSVREARASAEQLERELSTEGWVARLTARLAPLAAELTERYTVPALRVEPATGRLPAAVPTVEVAFREVVGALIEARINRDLHDVTGEVVGAVRELGRALAELERVIVFNVELAGTELDAVGDRELPEATREVVRAMALTAIGRHPPRLERTVEGVRALATALEDRVQGAVIGRLDELVRALGEGRDPDPSAAWSRARPLGWLARRAQDLSGGMPALRERAGGMLVRSLGADRLLRARIALGLRESEDELDLRVTFAPPAPSCDVPVVYRRLFADLPFEAGELLAGRDDEIQRLRAALSSRGGLRSAAVIGIDPHSARAIVTNAARGTLEGTLWLDPGGPADLETVEEWLLRAAELRDHAVVIENVGWLFERRPGGMAPLRRLAEVIATDRGRNAWVLLSDVAVWRHACVASPIRAAMGAVVELDALTPDELERAVMSRHAVSGFDVTFAPEEDLQWQLRHAFTRGDYDDRVRRAWFRTLHAASGGVLQDGLRLWLASVREVDETIGLVRIGPVPSPPAARLSELADDVLGTLLEATRQGWITAEQHARLFRTSAADALVVLAGLEHAGLLVGRDSGVLTIAPHLRGPLHRALAARGWAEG